MERPPSWRPPVPLPGDLHTGRLRVGWHADHDAPSLHRAVAADRDALLPWLPWAASDHRSPEESLDRIRGFARARTFVEADDFVMGIFDARTGDVVGGTGLHRIDRAEHSAEIGYWIRRDRQGGGLGTEAVAALITSAFRDWGLRRIRICCAGPNRASQRIPEKLGLRLERRAKRASWVDGLGWTDDLEYAVLADEWDAERQRGPDAT
ncbi:MAG: GNAT family N-acetyltransferase [Planctomycetota bacterium]|jgi:ribosomal-protein-serine acetyltransferase